MSKGRALTKTIAALVEMGRVAHDLNYGGRVSRINDGLEIAAGLVAEAQSEMVGEADPVCDGTEPHIGPWERIPKSDQASVCACGYVAGK